MKHLILPLLYVFILQSCTQNDPTRVTIETGTLQGFYSEDSTVVKFLGIPYAKPPIGDLRWAPPQKPSPWEGVREAKEYSDHAVTYRFADWVYIEEDNMSEDCLYLNVWRPAHTPEKPLPVLVQIHGGGFAAGMGSEPRLEGTSMAKEGMVVVSLNYRLNVFGFLAHPELTAESAHQTSGNYGIMDQQLALEWVRDNIEQFGGDPERITITGESAGSMSALALMTSPRSKDLIAGVIGSSGGIIPIPNLQQAEANGKYYADQSGLTSLKQLREASTEQIVEMYKKASDIGFIINQDGYVFPKSTSEIYKVGEAADIPVIIGWNSTELPPEALMGGMELTSENFETVVKAAFPKHYEDLLEEYPHQTRDEIWLSASELALMNFVVPGAYAWFDLHRKHSKKPTYRYIFSKVHPPYESVDLSTYEPALGAFHAQEIPYAWGNLPLSQGFQYTEDDYKVSDTMKAYMVNFIKTGNPNGEGLLEWSAVGPEDKAPTIMNFDTETKAISAEKDYRITDFLKMMGYE